jgi:hypothetical protein
MVDISGSGEGIGFSNGIARKSSDNSWISRVRITDETNDLLRD